MDVCIMKSKLKHYFDFKSRLLQSARNTCCFKVYFERYKVTGESFFPPDLMSKDRFMYFLPNLKHG